MENTLYVKSIGNGMFAYSVVDRSGQTVYVNVGSYNDIMSYSNNNRIVLMENK